MRRMLVETDATLAMAIGGTAKKMLEPTPVK